MIGNTHRAAVCNALDGPEAVTTQSVPNAPIGPGLVRIAVRAAGVNFPDYLLTRGEYQLKLQPPFVPGMEVAGVVTECGPGAAGVPSWSPGSPVIALTQNGGYAEKLVTRGDTVFPLPETFSYQEGATFLVAARTAYQALVNRAGVRAGETVLVLGATGGVGLAAVHLAKYLGARVVAVGHPAKLAVLEAAGADHVVSYHAGDLVDSVRERVGGADVVFDPVGGTLAARAMRLLRWGGRYLVVGFASGTISSFDGNRILLKGASVVGVRAGEAARRDPDAFRQSIGELLSIASLGGLRPHISHEFPLNEAAAALGTLSERRAIGRIVLSTTV
ncbi:NADPH2:quinone reductase [Mycobacterium sp. MAA66]|uniref:NADPH:quinone oxidoreductase family protein n=1 Tax=Mycobacterium sp. MAA66 TaxID=3156297 RepID=UPI003515004C